MSTTLNLRTLLHRKAWEFASPSPFNPGAGQFWAGDSLAFMPDNDCQYIVNGSSSIWNYNADQDAFSQLPSSGIAGSFNAGACGAFNPLGMIGGAIQNQATGGTINTINTNKSLVRVLAGCLLRVVAGTGKGYSGVIASNTTGLNSIITLKTASSVSFDATTVFRVWSGSLWFFNSGSGSVGFSVYDRATNSWTAKSVTGLPTTWGTCGRLVATPSVACSVDSGSVTSAAATTLTDTTHNWPAGHLINSQLRIVSGPGAGEVRTITMNTANLITVAGTVSASPAPTALSAMTRSASGVVTATVAAATATNLKPGKGYTISGCADTTFNAVYTILTVSGTTITLQGTNITAQATVQTGTGQDSWIVTPDATSTYIVEPDDDNLYLFGNNSAAVYKYSILLNAWVTLAPLFTRDAPMAAGGTADWAGSMNSQDWVGASGVVQSVIGMFNEYKQNGRYIFSFRGGVSNYLDVFDTATVVWGSIAYGNQYESFGGGSCAAIYGDYIYIHKEATGRLFRYNIPMNTLEPFAVNVYPQSTTVEGTKLAMVVYKDGDTRVPFLYSQQHSRPELLRMLVIG